MKHTKQKKYWFYLEPYVFIFKGNTEQVIYNTFNGFYLKCPSHESIQQIINKMTKSTSGYCVSIKEDILADPVVSSFILKIKHSFSGDLVSQQETLYKPFIFKPKLKIMNEAELNYKNKDISISGRNILKNLSEVTIYLNMLCKQSCKDCNQYYKQFTCCTKKNKMADMAWDDCLNLLNRLEIAGVSSVNFTGGNILEYKHWDLLMANLSRWKFKKRIYIHYLNSINENLYSLSSSGEFELKIMISPYFNEEKLKEIVNLYKSLHPIYIFILSSIQDLQYLEESTVYQSLDQIEWKVFYTGENYSFFEENVFLEYDGILNEPVNKKIIYRRQTVNEHFYGRLTIFPDGTTHANVNHTKLGNLLNQSLNEIVYKEMKEGKSWFYTRDRSVCRTCCNKYLCPSPSNYELVMKRMNLCKIIK